MEEPRDEFQRWAEFQDDIERDLQVALHAIDSGMSREEKLSTIFSRIDSVRESIVNSDYDW